MNLRPEYKEPLLAGFFRAAGLLIIALGLIWAVIMFFNQVILEALISFTGGLVAGVVYFGIAQCVVYLAKSAHHTEVLVWHQDQAHKAALKSHRLPGSKTSDWPVESVSAD